MRREERFKKFIKYFSIHQPVAETELKYNNPFHLLIAVILSAQCTDKRVNIITPPLFKKFPTPEKLAKATYAEVFNYIKSCSYPNNKSRHLVEMAKKLVSDFNSKLPSDVDKLQTIPGVGRKTANVIAAVVFKKPVMAVDTHVFRVSARIGLTINANNPLEAEKQLVKYIPEKYISMAHHWLILHGRYICMARKPKCGECGIKEICNYYKSSLKKTTDKKSAQ
ncbi:MAG: endonuclease III [Bacteroidales bacterium]|jgi:endonuclease-3